MDVQTAVLFTSLTKKNCSECVNTGRGAVMIMTITFSFPPIQKATSWVCCLCSLEKAVPLTRFLFVSFSPIRLCICSTPTGRVSARARTSPGRRSMTRAGPPTAGRREPWRRRTKRCATNPAKSATSWCGSWWPSCASGTNGCRRTRYWWRSRTQPRPRRRRSSAGSRSSARPSTSAQGPGPALNGRCFWTSWDGRCNINEAAKPEGSETWEHLT